jgi:hypothetical protein
MSWAGTASDEAVSWDDIRDAVDNLGLFDWAGDDEPLIPDWDDVPNASEVESFVYGEAGALATAAGGADRLPSKAEVGAWAESKPATPVTPQDLTATHHMASCPTRRVDLAWTNPSGKTGVTISVSHSLNGDSWDALTTGLAAGSTAYTHGSNGPSEGINYYRVKYNDEAHWSVTQTTVNCPE